MKKHIVLATGLALLSTSAFATKSRMEALGQDTGRGSHYIKDTRSIFRNAAQVNNFKNYIVTEWGTEATGADTAEGGFFREMGSFTYGLYLGSELGEAQQTAKNTAGYLSQTNRTQLFIGGDMGVQWGANLYYATNKDEQATTFEKKNNAFGLGLGAIFGDIEGYANLDISDKSEGRTGGVAGDKWEGDLGLDLGLSYSWNAWTFFAEYDMSGAEDQRTGSKTEYSDDMLTVGAGYIHEVSSTARLVSDFSFVMHNQEIKTTTKVEQKETYLPLTLGFEADATSWLTLRGSVSQNIFLANQKGDLTTVANNSKTKTRTNTTDVAAGATLTFGKLMVDGMIGTTSNAGAASTEDGTLSLDRLLTKVAVHYWF